VTILLDIGPLLAALDADDDYHEICVDLLDGLTGHLAVPAPVLVEVCYFLQADKRGGPSAEALFLESLAAGELDLIPTVSSDLTRMAELVRTYADLPLGAVDASVVAVAERLDVTKIATLDRRHFGVVRPRHTDGFVIVP
jgi:predicted nucleic acid-binding protein